MRTPIHYFAKRFDVKNVIIGCVLQTLINELWVTDLVNLG